MQPKRNLQQSIRIETIAIGDELLCGKIADTNSKEVAFSLLEEGIILSQTTVIPDLTEVIIDTLSYRSQKADYLIIFGGLGPTSDDLTMQAVCNWMQCNPIVHHESEKKLLHFLQERNRQINETVRKQVLYPQTAAPIFNSEGLATGFYLKRNKAECFFLPGVPHEMRRMFLEAVLPTILASLQNKSSLYLNKQEWRCIGIPESELQRKVAELENKLPPYAWLSFRTRFPENHLTLYLAKEKQEKTSKTEKEWQGLVQSFSQILKPYCYTNFSKEPEELVIDALKKKQEKLVVTESCTGGMIAERLTSIAGASQFFWGGYVVYTPQAKQKMLGLPLLSEETCVSKEVTKQLCHSARLHSGAQISLSITGYLGPLPGPKDSFPVGTFFLCIENEKGFEEFEIFQPHKNRKIAQFGAATVALCKTLLFLTKQ